MAIARWCQSPSAALSYCISSRPSARRALEFTRGFAFVGIEHEKAPAFSGMAAGCAEIIACDPDQNRFVPLCRSECSALHKGSVLAKFLPRSVRRAGLE